MNNVILYTRVSTEEQAENGFSLAAQKDKLNHYCKTNGLNVIKMFTDDYSAWKGFNRPGYNQMKEFLKLNKGKVDTILFTQWSRFSRDVTASYIEIERLKKGQIQVNAVEQMVDLSVAENQILLGIYLITPQVENDRLSDRTKVGMNQALKEGKWLWKAPYGYKNVQLVNGSNVKKCIEIDLQAAELVRTAFELIATGLYPAEEVRRKMVERGLTIQKQTFLNMLQNIFYTGKILIKAFKNKPETIKDGLHDAIISEEVFQSVQFVLSGKKKSYKGVTKNNMTPLVGRLYCPKCNKPMTGSGSKGNGGIYHYYHCQRKYGCKNAISASTANELFGQYLNEFKAKPETLELFQSILEDTLKTSGIDRVNENKRLQTELLKIEESLEKAAMKNLNGIWDDKTFSTIQEKLKSEKTALSVKLNHLTNLAPQLSSYVSNTTQLLGCLDTFYKDCDEHSRKKLIGSIFDDKIYFENNKYRTTKINEVVELLFNIDKGLNKNSPAKNARLSTCAPPAGLEPATL